MDPRCRIGKIKTKGNVSIVKTNPKALTHEDIEEMKGYFNTMVEYFPDEIAAITMVVISKSGDFSRATKIHKNAPFGTTLFPAYVAEILRRDTMEDICDGYIK